MTNYLKTTSEINIYRRHEKNAPIVATIGANELLSYTREKLRDGVEWLEIILKDKSMGYILNDKKTYYFCPKSKLVDAIGRGFSYKLLTDTKETVYELFKPIEAAAVQAAEKEGLGIVEMHRQVDNDNKETQTLLMAYDMSKVEVKTEVLAENEEFYVMHPVKHKSAVPFLETDNFSQKKGYFLGTTSTSELKDAWMFPVMILCVIGSVIGIIAFFLSVGWIVFGKILILIGIGVGFAAIIVVQILLMILNGIFKMIRKRF